MPDQDPIVTEALKRFKLADEAESEQRQREIEDLAFEFDPWPDAVKQARAGYTVAGVPVPARPMVNIPMLDQPVQLVINQEKAAHLGIQVHPQSDDADDDTAEVLQGLIRDIEVRSRASIARSWAFERAVKCGRGYYRILKRYCSPNAEGPAAFDQELCVDRILNQFSVYFDPEAIQPDNSDANWAFVTQDLSKDTYRREFGDSDLATMNEADFSGLGDDAAPWLGDETYRIAEYFTVERTPRARIAYDVGLGLQLGWRDELPDIPKAAIKNTRELETRIVRWRKINAVEVLEEVEWDGQYIPIVSVIGREYNLQGKRRWTGIIGQAKDSARLLNYAAATAVEVAAIDPKTPWILAEGQEEGHEAEFARASARPVPYVRYKPISIAGQLTPAPERNIQGVNLNAPLALIQEAKEFIHSSTFTFDPSLGNAPQKDRSGKAIMALQQQADAGNSHYLDNLAEVSMTYEAKVEIDMIPKVYDRPGRIARIIDGKDDERAVMLNAPFTLDPKGKPIPAGPDTLQGNQLPQMAPGAPQPPQNGQPGQQSQPPQKPKTYDLTQGQYSVVVSVGKSYQTKMQQGSDALGQLLQADPALMPLIGWRYFKYNDNIPGHNEIAEDLKKLRPKELQDEQDPEQAQAQLAQAQQQIALMEQALKEAASIIEKDKLKVDASLQIAGQKDATTLEIARMNNETKLAVAALTSEIQRLTLFLDERARLGVQGHEVGMAGMDAQREREMAELGHQQALEQGDQQIAGGMAQAEQGQSHALEQIAAQPPPQNGGGQA